MHRKTKDKGLFRIILNQDSLYLQRRQTKQMATQINNMELLTSILDEKGVSYKVDKNPTAEKMGRIKAAIKRKQEMSKAATDFFNNLYSH